MHRGSSGLVQLSRLLMTTELLPEGGTGAGQAF